jgi:hypothetical protein
MLGDIKRQPISSAVARPADEVRGTSKFASKLSALNRRSELWASVDSCLEELKANAISGIKIPKDLWPRDYATNYGITNLYKYNLAGAHRLLYAIYTEGGKLKVLAIDFMPHGDYERLFGY